MRTLLRRTIALVGRHPVLWVPYLCAACVTAGLTILRRYGDKAILRWLPTRTSVTHSILSPSLTDNHVDEAAFIRAAERIHYVLRWAVHDVDDCIYALAIVLTALLLKMILSEQRTGFRASISTLGTYPRRVLVYASKLWILSVVLTVFVTIPATKLSDLMPTPRHAAIDTLFIGVDVLWAFCFAWVIAPVAITLLRPVGAAAVTIEEKRRARYLYFLIQLVAFMLGHFIDPLLYKVPLESSVQRVVADLAGIVFNFPFVLLYVAFALIAQPDLLASQDERPSSSLTFLKTLMPLHFGRGEDL